jgi:carboxyl-terminal processing protease
MRQSFLITRHQQPPDQWQPFVRLRRLLGLVVIVIPLYLVGCGIAGQPVADLTTNLPAGGIAADITSMVPTLSPVHAPTEMPTASPSPEATPTTEPAIDTSEAPTATFLVTTSIVSSTPPTSVVPSTPPTILPRPTDVPTEAPTPSSTPVTIQPTPTLPVLSPDERAARFDEIWQTVEDSYLYSDFGGIDWEAVRADYRPQALTAETSEQFYATLKEMIDLLNDRHSRYLSPQDAYREQARTSGTAAFVGIGVNVVGTAAGGRIDMVFRDSPAEAAGLRRRDVIISVNGHPYASNAAGMSGPEGTSVRLVTQSPGEEAREIVVERRAVVHKLVPEAYRLADTDVGYLLIQSFWADDMGEQVIGALEQLIAERPIDGLIIDLRGNGGGWRTVLETLLSTFMEGKAGEFYRQDQARAIELTPNALNERLKTTPIVVLVDQQSQSYTEVFAAALQAAGRASVIGQQTAGNTETIFAYDFDDLSRLWIAGEGFRLPSGEDLEGRGVIPDVIIDADWAAYSEADDPHIVKALELLGH